MFKVRVIVITNVTIVTTVITDCYSVTDTASRLPAEL